MNDRNSAFKKYGMDVENTARKMAEFSKSRSRTCERRQALEKAMKTEGLVI